VFDFFFFIFFLLDSIAEEWLWEANPRFACQNPEKNS